MIQLLAALVGIGIILSIFTGPIGLVVAVPAAGALLWVLRARQAETEVDQRFVGGPQPDKRGIPKSDQS